MLCLPPRKPLRPYAGRAVNRVALFGTRFVIESDFNGQLPGVTIARPSPQEVDLIHNT
jgi:hypothetical protein